MSWYWKRKSTWRKDLITYNSHPWIMFSLSWLDIIWRGGVRLKLYLQGQGGGRILEVDGRGGGGPWKLENFPGRHVYHSSFLWKTRKDAFSILVSLDSRVVMKFHKISWEKVLACQTGRCSGLISAYYCMRYPHTVPFLKNKMPYPLPKPPKTHAI